MNLFSQSKELKEKLLDFFQKISFTPNNAFTN